MDIKIKSDTGNFYYVVRGVIEQDGKYLAAQITFPDGSKSAWHFPGGHVDIGETADEAIHRELREEIDCEIDARSFCVLENFWEDNGNLAHGLEIYYIVMPLSRLCDKDYSKTELDRGIKKTLDFKWLFRTDLHNFDLRPKLIKQKLINNELDGFNHYSNKKQ